MAEEDVRTDSEAVGIFHRADAFQDAIDELLSSGFHRADLSLLASRAALDEKLGRRYVNAAMAADDPAVPRISYISPEDVGDAEGGLIGGLVYVGATIAAGAVTASGGTLALVIAATAVAGGFGGVIGSVLAKRVGAHHGRHLQEQIERGGLLLWVRTRNIEHEERAVDILRRHCGRDVHVHPQRSEG